VGLVGLGGLSEPFLDVFDFTSFRVINTGLVVGRVELEGGVSLDLNSFNLVEGSIKLGHDDVRSLDVFTKLFPLGGERLAVTTPGSVELDKHILGLVVDNLIVLVSDDDLDGAVILLGDRLRLSVCNELSILEVFVEFGDSLSGEVLNLSFPDVLDETGSGGDDSQTREVSLRNTNELSKSLLDSSGNTRVREKHLSLKVLGSFAESLLVVGVSLLSEEDHSRVSLREDRLNVVFSEFEESRNRVSSQPGVDIRKISRVNNVRFVESASHGDSVGSSSNFLSAFSSSVPENEFLVSSVLGSSKEGIVSLSSFLSVVDSVELTSGLGIKVGTGNILGRVTGLLGDPVDDGVGGTASSVFLVFAINKPFKRWESLDIESLA
jgi:hypothetical protein